VGGRKTSLTHRGTREKRTRKKWKVRGHRFGGEKIRREGITNVGNREHSWQDKISKGAALGGFVGFSLVGKGVSEVYVSGKQKKVPGPGNRKKGGKNETTRLSMRIGAALGSLKKTRS